MICFLIYVFFRFPPKQFGFLMGTSLLIAGIFGFLQHALLTILIGPLQGEPFWVRKYMVCFDQDGILRKQLKIICAYDTLTFRQHEYFISIF